MEMSEFRCPKCGKSLKNKYDLESHIADCKGETFTLDMIEKIAKGESLEPELGFHCQICGENQKIESIEHLKLYQPAGMCDNCKRDLKDIILAKRKDERKR